MHCFTLWNVCFQLYKLIDKQVEYRTHIRLCIRIHCGKEYVLMYVNYHTTAYKWPGCVCCSFPTEWNFDFPVGFSLEVPFKCKECGHMSPDFTSHNRHRTTHRPRTHQCPECVRAFHRSDHLKQHIRDIHRREPFPCHYCQVVLNNRGALNKHIKSMHPHNQRTNVQSFSASTDSSLRW